MTENTDTKNRLKSAGIIFVTLVFGMVIGGLITARITQNRLDKIESLRSQRGFAHFIEQSIEYDSPEQRQQVAEILDRASENMFQHMRGSRRQAIQILDSVRTDLSHILTDEQLQNLDKHLARHRRDRPMRPDDRPPPGRRDRP